MPGKGEMRRIQAETRGDFPQADVEPLKVRSIAGYDDVPGRKLRLRHKQQEAALLGMPAQDRHDLLRAAAAAMEQRHQRRRGQGIDTLGNDQHIVARIEQAEVVPAGRKWRLGRGRVLETQAAEKGKIEHGAHHNAAVHTGKPGRVPRVDYAASARRETGRGAPLL